MTVKNTNFDSLLNQWYLDVYRFCFLLSCHGDAARDLVFQTFLYAGADPNFPDKEPEASMKLFSYAFKTCNDYYLRKMRRIPSRKILSESVTFFVSDTLLNFLKLPVKKKAALVLHKNLSFSISQTQGILNLSHGKAEKLLSPSASKAALSQEDYVSILPDHETASQISDDLYIRFEERNVKLENRLRDIRLAMDQSIIWIALIILGIFGAAALYSSGL